VLRDDSSYAPRAVLGGEVAPPRPLATGRTTWTLDALEQDYALGRECGHVAVRGWTALGMAPGAATAARARVA
jgi:hypothetical protein